VAVSVNVPVEVPLTDTRSSWPVETDNVPVLAEDDEPDGDEPDGEDEEPVADVGLALPWAPGVAGDRKALGAVVPAAVDAEGAEPFAPFPPWPDGPPRADDGLLVPTDAPCADPPAAPAEGGP
jgi:hypothetical protein